MIGILSATDVADGSISANLIARVNRLYHELTQPGFDTEHAYRHRVEAEFWKRVARGVLDRGAAVRSSNEAAVPRAVLDLACGTGFVSSILQSSLGRHDRLIAVDLSVPALRAAAGKMGAPGDDRPRLCTLSAGSESLPLADGSVDLVAVNASLHHFANPAAALREVDRVLRIGGHLAVGFEPNACYFQSTVLPALGHAIDRLGWYFSVRQNRRRLRQWLGAGREKKPRRASRARSDFVTDAINRRLLVEHLVERPLSREDILDLVDPHARGASQEAGFHPRELVETVLPNYHILELTTSDYLGETMRRVPCMRCAVDSVLKHLVPRHGSLFCCLLQKGTSR